MVSILRNLRPLFESFRQQHCIKTCLEDVIVALEPHFAVVMVAVQAVVPRAAHAKTMNHRWETFARILSDVAMDMTIDSGFFKMQKQSLENC